MSTWRNATTYSPYAHFTHKFHSDSLQRVLVQADCSEGLDSSIRNFIFLYTDTQNGGMIRNTLKLKTSKTPGWDIFAIHSGLRIPSFIIVITYFWKKKIEMIVSLLLSCSFLADRVSKTSRNFGEIFLHSCFPSTFTSISVPAVAEHLQERCYWLRCRVWCSPSMLSNLMAKNLFAELLEVFVLQF